MRRKITQKNIAVICKCTTTYVSRVLNNPKQHNTERAKQIKRLAYDHLEGIIRNPLFLAMVRKYKARTQDEEDTLDEWKYTFKLYNNKLAELEKVR